MATVNGVYDARSAWSGVYTSYREYRCVEDLYANLITLNRILGENPSTTNTNVEDMFCNVLIEHGNGGPNVNSMLTTFTALLTNAISGAI